MKKLILKDFVLEEISGVDRPAQVGAKMSIIKRKQDNDEGKDMSVEQVKELQKQVADLTDALAIAKSLGSLTDAEKQYMDGLSDEVAKNNFVGLKADDRKVQMDLAKQLDETFECNGAVISKSAVGAELFEVLKNQQAQLEKQRVETQKAREVAMTAGFIKKAADNYSHLPGTSEEVGALLRETADISKGAQATLSTILESLEKMNASTFITQGHSGGKDEDQSAVEKLDQLAKAHAEKHNIDYATAYSTVIEKNAELYAQSIN